MRRFFFLIVITAINSLCLGESENSNLLNENPFELDIEAWISKKQIKVGPSILSIIKDENTGKFELYWEDTLHDIEYIDHSTINEIYLSSNGQKRKLSFNKNRYSTGVSWILDDLKGLEDGDVISGVIKAKIAVDKYVVEDLKKGSTLKKHGLTIQVKKYDGKPRYLCPFGEYALWEVTEENKDRMWYVVVTVDNCMSKEDAEYVQQVQKDYYDKKVYPRKAAEGRYRQIKDKTTTVKVHDIWRMPTKELCSKCIEGKHESDREKYLCRLERGIQHEIAFQVDKSNTGFDCLQDGRDVMSITILGKKKPGKLEDVFPIGIEITKYEPRELKFEIVYEGSGLKKLTDPVKPKDFEVRENSMGMKFVWIPAGEFMMGSKLSASEIEKKYGGFEKTYQAEHPRHSVKISKGFWIGQYEVTQLQYKTLMGTNPSNYRYKCPHCDDFLSSEIVKEGVLKDVGGSHPVETVSWDDAKKFCEKLGEKEGLSYNLPTEAQWEYACRGGTSSAYSFGDKSKQLKKYAWYDDNSKNATHPVGEKEPNPWGLYDMHGNVSEWCLDYYEKEYYSNSEKTDPCNKINRNEEKNIYMRVLRGGCSFDTDENCRSAARYYAFTKRVPPMADRGFRVVCEKKE